MKNVCILKELSGPTPACSHSDKYPFLHTRGLMAMCLGFLSFKDTAISTWEGHVVAQ